MGEKKMSSYQIDIISTALLIVKFFSFFLIFIANHVIFTCSKHSASYSRFESETQRKL